MKSDRTCCTFIPTNGKSEPPSHSGILPSMLVYARHGVINLSKAFWHNIMQIRVVSQTNKSSISTSVLLFFGVGEKKNKLSSVGYELTLFHNS